MKTHSILVVLLLASAISQSGCTTESQSKNPQKENAQPTIPVEAETVKRGDVAAYYHGTASLEARDEATAMSEVGGFITGVFVEEGDFVKQGDLLAQIDREPYEIELARVEASLNRLQNEFERNKTMFERNLVSAEVFENVKFELEVQKANLDLAKRNLDQTSIRAPISGVVAARFIKAGNRIAPNQAAFDVIQMNPLLAVLHVPEHEIGKIRPGQRVSLNMDARSAEIFTGKVERVSPVIDRATGTAKVTVLVNDATGVLKPGMFARVSIVHSLNKNTLIIPRQAIMSEDGRMSAYVIQDSIAVRKRLTTGFTNGNYIEVLDGVSEGEQVVTVGQASLRDTSRIEVIHLN
ncbi:MAG: efflux RND transporter periplasmic adaptor subunit [Balneolaceae bacterium]|nr:MAG: efflux RND transporter periplasmic adaptor subunit [Balneolaceae bacterium]